MVFPLVCPPPSVPRYYLVLCAPSLGAFTDEVAMQDRWMTRHAGHVHVSNLHAGLEVIVQDLSIKRWVLQELTFWPIGLRTMFRYIQEAWEAKSSSHTFTTRIPVTDEELEDVHVHRYGELEGAIARRHNEAFTHFDEMVRQQPQPQWGQQHRVGNMLQERIDAVLEGVSLLDPWQRPTDALRYVRPLYIDGPPGSGKTHVMLQACASLRHRGVSDLDWEIVGLSALRAGMLGGTHIHELFGFRPGKSNLYTTPQALAVSGEVHLRRHPEKKRRLQDMLFLFIDELGQVGGEMLQGINLLLQKVRGNDHPFGGLCVIAAGDHYQTDPIGMRPPFLSAFMRTHFEVVSLTQLVRSRADPLLQEVINLMRVPRLTEQAIARVLDIVLGDGVRPGTVCTHRAVDSVPNHAVWLLSRKEAVQKAREERYTTAQQAKHKFDAQDELLTPATWTPCRQKEVVGTLNRQTALVPVCYIIVGDRVAVTQNFYPSGRDPRRVPNGLCGEVTDFNTLRGTVIVRFDDHRTLTVSRETSVDIETSGSRRARRRQLPLELAAASTIHDVQGQTVAALATYLDAEPEHALWSRSMLFTLFTRVGRLSDIHLVGPPAEMRGILASLLRHHTSWHAEVDVWLQHSNLLCRPPVTASSYSTPSDFAFVVPSAIQLQPPGVNVAYLIESLHGNVWYAGSTNNMQGRLYEHNIGHTLMTANHRDWRYILVVRGFEGGSGGLHTARLFEQQVKNRRAHRRDRLQFEALFRVVIAEWRRDGRARLELESFP